MPASSFLQNCQDRAGLARRMPRRRAGAECPTHACVSTNAAQSGTPAQQWRTPATPFGLRSIEDSFAEFLSGIAAHVKPRTHQRYRVSGRRLAVHFEARKPVQICSRDLEDFKRLRPQECSRAGTNRGSGCTQNISKLVLEDWISQWRVSGAASPRRIGEHADRFLRRGASLHGRADRLLRDVATIIIECGLRPGEVFQMEGGHVNLSGKYISIPTGKTRFARRTIPLTNKAYGVFARLWRPGKLFDGSVPHQVVMRRHKAVCRGLAFDFRLYDFRHTYGSRMAMAGVDLMTLRELMGHSSITITQRYCHPTPEHKLAAVAKLVEYNEAATKKPQSDLTVIQ